MTIPGAMGGRGPQREGRPGGPRPQGQASRRQRGALPPPVLRAVLLLLLAFTAAAVEAPALDPLAPISVREDEGDEARLTILVTGISPPAAVLQAGTGDSALARILRIDRDPGATSARVVLSLVYDAHGDTLVYVSAAVPGAEPAVRTCRLAVAPEPDPPLLNASSLWVRSGATLAIDDTTIRITDADDPPASELTLTVTAPATVGDLLLDGTTVLAAGARFSAADLAAGRLSFRHNGRTDVAYDTIAVDLSDGSFPMILPRSLPVFTDARVVPVLDLGTPPAPWIEGGGEVAVCPQATVVDPDTFTFAGLRLILSLDAAQARVGDVLEFRHAGTGAGQIAVAGADLSYGGAPIGTWSGGSDGRDLVTVFANQTASPAAVQALLRSLRFRHAGRDPGADRRLVQAVLEDHASGPSAPATAALAVVLVDDPPAVATAGVGTLAGVARTLRLVASDPDSSAFTWAITAQPQVAELTLLDPATGLLRIAPRPGLSGTDRFAVTLSDRVNPPVAATLALRITGFDDPRPQPLADPPFAAVAGELLRADIPWDAVVAVTAAGEVPAGLVLTPLSATSVRLEWTLPVAEPPGLRAFALLATSLSDHATGRLPVLLRVLPRPGGIQ